MNLKIENLSKTYSNGTKALSNVSLDLSPGLFGLLGPNGAGKSTLMRTLACLQLADSGTASLDGLNVFENPTELRKVLGYLPQEFGVYPHITASQLLDHMAVLKGVSKRKERKDLVDHLLNKVNLFQHRNKKVKGFSGGMKQRVGIAQALIGSPKLIIVDEPTAGLDPAERNRFHNLLAEVGEQVIVILSTHIVADVNELCKEIAIMNLGKIVFQGSPIAAVEELRGKVWTKTIDRTEKELYRQQFQVISDKLIAGQPNIHVLSDVQPADGFRLIEPNLEDLYFTRTQS